MVPSEPTVKEKQAWIRKGVALEILGCSPGYLDKLTDNGVLTCRRLLDGWSWYLRTECEELAAKSIRRSSRQYAGGAA